MTTETNNAVSKEDKAPQESLEKPTKQITSKQSKPEQSPTSRQTTKIDAGTHGACKVADIPKLSDSEGSQSNQEKSFSRGRPSSCVFVASLAANRTDDELSVAVANHFQKWGSPSTVKVLRDTCNRPYAFVQYSNDLEAKRAIKFGHNSLLNGRNIRCEPAKVNRTLFLSSLNLFTEKGIENTLLAFGEIEQLAQSDRAGGIIEPRSSKGSRAWYCKFVYRDDAIRAFANLSEGHTFEVEWAQNIDTLYNDPEIEELESKPSFDKFSIFIGQLSSEIREKDLRERFLRHGVISHVDLIRKPGNTFAFVKYEDESSAASAVERENHSMLCGKTMHVQYRETYVSPGKPFEKVRGIALAPPPINLNRRFSSVRNDKAKKILSKPKFTGNPSNSFNRRRSVFEDTDKPAPFGRFQVAEQTSTKEKKTEKPTKATNSIYNKTSRGSSKENSPTNSPRRENGSVPTNYSFSGNPSSDKTSPVSDHNSFKRNNANVPYFYYIPGSEPQSPPMNAKFGPPLPNAGGPPPPPHPSFFYPPYFMPYDNHEFSGQIPPPFPMHPFPIYYQPDPDYN